jgi:uncharacterized protein involved in outer membrane biogenesis
LFGALVIFIILFQWNWLRAPLAHAMSARLHRPVAITGDLEVHPWSWSPQVTVNGLTIGNPAWAGPGPMATLPRLTVQISLRPLLEGGRLILPLIRADRPDVWLRSDATGRANWTFDASATKLPSVEHLVVVGGRLHFDDVRGRMTFVGAFSSDEGASQRGGGRSVIDGAFTAGAAAWAGPTPTVHVPRLLIQLKALPLMTGGKLVLPLVEADRPVIRGVRDASGRESWNLTGQKQQPFKAPPINHFIVSNGAIKFDDAKRNLHLEGVLSSSEDVDGAGRGNFRLDGKGKLNNAPFVARVTGDPLIDVDPSRPYPFDARLESGLTRLRLSGKIAHPFDFTALSGKFFFAGPDLAELYHFTGLALPSTPPYELTAGFGRYKAQYALSGIQGHVGSSDLGGSVSINDATGRPFLKADLASKRLRLVDLAAIVGGVPKHSAGERLSPTQKVVAATLKAEHRLLPDTHLDVSRVRAMDANLRYKAQSVEAGGFPIRALQLNLTLDHGVITANPLDMTLPQGRLAGTIRVDARKAIPATALDMRLTNARLETLTGQGAANPPLEGGLFAHVKVAAAGDSVRSAAADMGGSLTVAIPSGKIRRSLAELLGIDIAEGLFLVLSKNQSDAPIRCGIAEFRAHAGILTAQRIVFDTGPVLAQGSGDIDLRDETVNLTIQGKPKGFRLLRLGAPITVKGSLQAPKVGVDVAKAVPQALLSAAIGILAAPVAAIIPFLHAGGPSDVDCPALMAQAASGVAVGRR